MAWLVHSTAAFVCSCNPEPQLATSHAESIYFGKAFRCHCEMPSWRCNTSCGLAYRVPPLAA
eukprot:4043783-Prymnesium_polylepis.1